MSNWNFPCKTFSQCHFSNTVIILIGMFLKLRIKIFEQSKFSKVKWLGQKSRVKLEGEINKAKLIFIILNTLDWCLFKLMLWLKFCICISSCWITKLLPKFQQHISLFIYHVIVHTGETTYLYLVSQEPRVSHPGSPPSLGPHLHVHPAAQMWRNAHGRW